MREPWALLVRRGAQALLEGRFRACERLAGAAAARAPCDPGPGLLVVAALREQGRVAEAEIQARCFLADHPEDQDGRALFGAVLADLGRDADARRQLDQLDFHRSPVVAALAAEVAAALDLPEHAEAVREALVHHAGAFAGCHGSTFRHLGLVCHVLGRWDEAEAHFDRALAANEAAGAPVLVAHTRRQYSALLRARGGDGDWDRAIDLLAPAATIYRRLEIERLAEETEAVLRRSQDPVSLDAGTMVPNLFRRRGAGWDLGYRGQRATVPDAAGLGHIAVLLAAEGRPVHAVDLVDTPASESAGDQVVAEYQARLAAIDGQLAAAAPMAAALARAERDLLQTELALLAGRRPPLGVADVSDRARRLVALRIRTCLDDLEGPLPGLATHLRRSIRTGMFCLYTPEQPERWILGG